MQTLDFVSACNVSVQNMAIYVGNYCVLEFYSPVLKVITCHYNRQLLSAIKTKITSNKIKIPNCNCIISLKKSLTIFLVKVGIAVTCYFENNTVSDRETEM